MRVQECLKMRLIFSSDCIWIKRNARLSGDWLRVARGKLVMEGR